MSRYVDPRHGTHEPTTGSPPRRPGSVRRTTTVDALRPGGVATGLRLAGRGRDVVTAADGTPCVVATATMDVDLAYTGGAVVEEIRTWPEVTGVEALIGKVATTGFRAVIDRETAAQRGYLVYLLLDEIPASTLVSGYAVGHAASRGELEAQEMSRLRPPGPALQVPDLCAGFQVGGVIQRSIEDDGRAPLVTGPIATPVVDPDDPDGWHELGPLAPNEMRRARRHDLWRDADGALHVDSFFRDGHVAPDGIETIVHEYTVEATVSADATTVLACRATPRVLPWLECPQAAASAERLVGMRVFGLRPQVRAELIGPTTCTHLNDTLRELEDVVALAPLLGSLEAS